jgi:hypothetical protein
VISSEIESIFEKSNEAEIEHMNLQNIANCCFVNPPTSKTWARGLEKIITNLKALISAETTEIESNQKETELLNWSIRELQDSYFNKLTA